MNTQFKFASYCLDVLKQIKLFHWFTTDYNFHKKTDKLYTALSKEIDAIVEGCLSNGKLTLPSPPKINAEMIQTLYEFETYIDKITNPRIRANVDNAIQIIGKFAYLYAMS